MSQVQRVTSNWSINANDLARKRFSSFLQQTLPSHLGKGVSDFYPLDPDINYIETRYSPTKDFKILSKIEDNDPKIIVTLGLKGHSSFAAQQADDIPFKEGYTTVTSFASSSGERVYKASQEICQLRISLSKDGVRRYFGEPYQKKLFGNNDIRTLSHRPISSNSLKAVQQLSEIKRLNQCSQLHLHAQALTILASELEALFENDNPSAVFSQKDKELAWAAREILINEFKNPPSVALLSRRIGVNQLRLKKLFHHFFDCTPYAMLTSIRMHTAYKMLETGDYHVGIVADHVGYQQPNNFSAAFRKFFSIAPKEVARK